MTPSTPEPRTPDGSPHPERDYEGDYEGDIGAARWKADQNRKHAEAAREADMAAAQQRYHDAIAEIDRIEAAQIANVKRRHGKDGE